MKTLKHATYLALALLTTAAHAGGSASGGGAAIVCKREATSYNDNTIGSVHLLDLQEVIDANGRGRNKLKIPLRYDLDSDLQFDLAAKRLEAVANFRLKDGTNVNSERKALEENMDVMDGKLLTPSDLGTRRAISLPQDCEISAIGYRQADGTLALSKPLYENLQKNPTHRAAFWMHEAVYSMVQKITGQSTLPSDVGTENIRGLVASLFAQNSSPEDILAAFRKLGLSAEMEKSGAMAEAKYAAEDVMGAEASYVRKTDSGSSTDIGEIGHACGETVRKDFTAHATDPAIMALTRKLRMKNGGEYLSAYFTAERSSKTGWLNNFEAAESKLFFRSTRGYAKIASAPDVGPKSEWHSTAVNGKNPSGTDAALNEIMAKGACSFSAERIKGLLKKAIGPSATSTASESDSEPAAETSTGSAE